MSAASLRRRGAPEAGSSVATLVASASDLVETESSWQIEHDVDEPVDRLTEYLADRVW